MTGILTVMGHTLPSDASVEGSPPRAGWNEEP